MKFLHCADLHLGSPFHGLGCALPQLAATLAEAPYRAFSAIVALAIAEKVDFMVIAGDLFDRTRPTLAGRLRFIAELEQLAEAAIAVFIAAGNHDPLPEAWTGALALPANVHLFGGDEVEFFTVERDNVPIARIGGISHDRPRLGENLALRFPEFPAPGFRVGVLHADVGGTGNLYAPTTLDELVRVPLDYWALGHVHSYAVLRAASPTVVYPGCPQGRAVNESGPRGCVLVTVDSSGRVTPEFRAVEAVRFEEFRLNRLAGVQSVDGLFQQLREALEPFDRAVALLVRLRLCGATVLNQELRRQAPEELAELFRQKLATFHPLCFLEGVHLETRGNYDPDELAATDELAGEVAAALDELCAEAVFEDEAQLFRKFGVEFTTEEFDAIRRAAEERLLDCLTGNLEMES